MGENKHVKIFKKYQQKPQRCHPLLSKSKIEKLTEKGGGGVAKWVCRESGGVTAIICHSHLSLAQTWSSTNGTRPSQYKVLVYWKQMSYRLLTTITCKQGRFI